MHLNHVTLPAEDYESSRAFCLALGLTQIVAAAGTAETYQHCDDVDAEVAAARRRGIIFDYMPRDEEYLWRRSRMTDPAGNRIFLYHAGKNHRFPPWRLDGLTTDPETGPDANTSGERPC